MLFKIVQEDFYDSEADTEIQKKKVGNKSWKNASVWNYNAE